MYINLNIFNLFKYKNYNCEIEYDPKLTLNQFSLNNLIEVL